DRRGRSRGRARDRADAVPAAPHAEPRRSGHPEGLMPNQAVNDVMVSLQRFAPELALTIGLLLVVTIDATGIAARNAINKLLTLATLAVALYLCGPLADASAAGPIFSNMIVVDPMGVFFKIVLIAASLFVLLIFTFSNSRELE